MSTIKDTPMQQRRLTDVAIEPAGIDRFDPLVGEKAATALRSGAERARDQLAGRTVWNVNSTDKGGGVAEMLHALLPYVVGLGVDARWVVIDADDEFFVVTKRLHNHLHDEPGDGRALDDVARAAYERTLAANRDELVEEVAPGDVVLFHDPQTAGLIPAVKARGARVVWRCHIGADNPGPLTRGAWDFLRPYVLEADVVVFTCQQHVWDGLDDSRVVLVAPSIDAFSSKNSELSREEIAAVLDAAGVLTAAGPHPPTNIRHVAEMIEDEPLSNDAPIVVQVSRWDRLKDPVGVLNGFARYVAPHTNAQLVLAGPESAAVADDPEGAEVMTEVIAAFRRLDPAVRARVHLACLPMADEDENSLIVNALQRRADVVVQKSLAEGFGLTVAEAMWKCRPVVASACGGIKEQIIDGDTGLLVDDPEDLRAFGDAVVRLLTDGDLASRVGRAAHERVLEHFLAPRHLLQYVDIIARLLDDSTA